ncbi:hypothetical protein F511_40813 [Dorcoceras hygrometricum]|uniref:Uncharacterized protein n=1 Tax=Dorcoceras hygrometricum TaxID=472368 RepID=A0A2Z7D8S0_9LAMI|nr:hypothetical protein F511_40813 [Dorcoceras hygrometricum]
MSSIDDRVVVEFVQSLGSPSSSGAVDTSNPPDKASRRELLARINAEEAILSVEGRPWYEVKASLLQDVRPGIKPTRRILPPPAQEYDPTPFLKAACAKCFNARDLVRDDLLCHFGFSRKGVLVEGDLGTSLGSELSRRVSKARETARSSRRSLDEFMVEHNKLMKEIEDFRGASDVKKKSLEQKLAASEVSVMRLQEEIKEVEEEAEEKIKRVQEEAESSWEKRKEDFLKSDEFDRLCATRALSIFQKDFDGCLAQIRDNGYSKAEHPFSLLDILKSLEALPDEGEVESSRSKK